MTTFGNTVIADMIRLRTSGWALIHHDLFPYQKKASDTGNTEGPKQDELKQTYTKTQLKWQKLKRIQA